MLRLGCLFSGGAPSRNDWPERAPLLPPEPPLTFDAENGRELLRRVLPEVGVERWDCPFVRLPDAEAFYGKALALLEPLAGRDVPAVIWRAPPLRSRTSSERGPVKAASRSIFSTSLKE